MMQLRLPAERPFGKLGKWSAAGLLALAASAGVNYTLARRAERRNPPAGRFIVTEGVRLHYIERGTGPTVVLLHGVGAMTDEMALSGVIDALAADHRVIAFDRPGFGYSERPRGRIWTPAAQAGLLHGALDKLRVERPVIVGHSWGTLVALEMALRDPDKTAGLVLLSGYYFPTFRLDVPLLVWPAVPVVGDVLRYAITPWLTRLAKPLLYKWLFAPAPVTSSLARGFPSEMVARPWQLRATAAEVALLIPGAAALAGRYAELSVPIAIVAGTGDKVVGFERHSARLHVALPRSMLREMAGSGHMVHHDAPQQVAGIIRDLVRAPQTAAAIQSG